MLNVLAWFADLTTPTPQAQPVLSDEEIAARRANQQRHARWQNRFLVSFLVVFFVIVSFLIGALWP